LFSRKVNMIRVVCQKRQYNMCCVPEKWINTYHIDFSGTQHLLYCLLWHKKLIILTLSGIQHLPYWLFWHTTLIIWKVNMVNVECLKGQYDKCFVPEKAIWYMLYARKFNMVSIVFQKSQYDKSTFSDTQHLSYWLFWHTTLTILTFLACNIYHIDFSSTQHLSYWLFWHTSQYDKCCMPEKSIW
jgi:hypothetical protein